MDVTWIKPIIENIKEIGLIAKEVRDFDPDKRINRLEGKLDKYQIQTWKTMIRIRE